MLRVALLGVLLQAFLQTGIAEAVCCDDIRSDIENRTHAFNVLCAKNDPHLGNCCRVIEQDLRKHKISYRILCPSNGNFFQLLFMRTFLQLLNSSNRRKFNLILMKLSLLFNFYRGRLLQVQSMSFQCYLC